MKKSTKEFIWDFLMGLIFAIILVFIIIIYNLIGETLLNYIGQENIETSCIIIKEFSLICLTLFGFTLIGGIFNPKEKKKEEKWDRIELTKRTLLVISLMFLLSFLLLQLSYIKIYQFVEGEQELIRNLLMGGLSFYVLGILLLFVVLIGFFFFRYTHYPEAYERFKSRIVK